MPDPAAILILLALAAAAAVFVALPLLTSGATTAPPEQDDVASLAVRHRIAIETLRDIEVDRRAGLLDDASYGTLRAEAEDRAAQTLAELGPAGREVAVAQPSESSVRTVSSQPGKWSARRVSAALGIGLAILLIAGELVSGPVSLANGVVVDQQLAAAQASERSRQAQITQLRRQLTVRPNDPATLVALANLYLAGGSDADRQTAARLLLFAVGLDPHNTEAYRLLITAYIAAGDYADAGKATDAFARIAPSDPDVAFFRGVIALQGSGDRVAAVRWFDAFLKAAPDDPRAVMVRSLRAEAAGSLP